MKKYISIIASLAILAAFTPPTYAMESRSDLNLKGIDVSHWDGPIDWFKVSSNGVKFAYLKASEGTTKVDSEFANYVKGAKANSIAIGAYHYAKPSAPYDSNEAVNEATFFVNTMKPSMADFGDIMPVLDLEENGGLSPNDLAQWARTFIHTVEQLTHRQVMIYISADFLQSNGYLNSALSDVPIWVSYWDQYYQGQNPPDIAGWRQWTAWQYSSQGTLPGLTGSVDLDVGPTSLDVLRGELTTAVVQSIPTTTALTTIKLQIGSLQAMINGKEQQLDIAPFTVENRTMVPIRFISEALGAKVNWNPAKQQVTINMNNATLVLTNGQKTALVNGKAVTLDVPSRIVKDRTFVPLRFISENLGRHIDYNTNTQSITIS
jgi:GH25 family lysozyme M1 (1,4-beta-N-acetylmuramidase)